MKKHPKSQPVKAKPEQQNANSTSNPVIVSCMFPSLTDEERTEKKGQYRRERRKFLLEVSGFIVLSVYTVFTGFMFVETRKAASAAQKSADASYKVLTLDQRTWLTISVSDVDIREGFPISVTVHISNIGKTIAKRIDGDIRVSLVESGQAPDFVYVRARGYPNRAVQSGAMFPNTPPFDTKVTAQEIGRDVPILIVLTPELHKQLLDGKLYVATFGKLSYFDVFGISHWTAFCFVNGRSTVDSAKCTGYNDTDNN